MEEYDQETNGDFSAKRITVEVAHDVILFYMLELSVICCAC
jgi:hypothetical protein